MNENVSLGLLLLLSILAAAIPTMAYVFVVWWLDRYEKEPVSLLAVAFLWGAIPGVVLSVIAELIAGVPTSLLGEGVAAVLDTSFTAPVVEELVKALALFFLFLAFYKEFDGVLDGIVYGALVGFGFALTENVLYFLNAFDSGGFGQWGTVVLLRTVVFGLNHALFTSIVGAGLGLIRYRKAAWQRILIPLLALLLAMTLHGIHNLFAQLNDVLCGTILVSLISDWGGVVVIVVIAVLAWRREKTWIVLELADEVRRGVLTGPEYGLVQSPLQRLGARWDAWGSGGWMAYGRLGRFFQLVTDLAFKKHQARTMGDERGNLAEIEHLRKQIAALRKGEIGR